MAAAVKDIAAAEPPAQVGIRYVRDEPGITSAVIGLRIPDQLGETLKAAASADLTEYQKIRLRSGVAVNYYMDDYKGHR